MENVTQIVDFTKYKNVFCDSQEALQWAYKKGLPKNALIRTSSPALLHSKDSCVRHVEESWSSERIKKFQSGMLDFSKEIFDSLIVIEGVTRAMAIGASQDALRLHLFLYKTGCLNKNDLIEERLFISVDGFGGRYGNNMNSPWDEILIKNPHFKKITYSLNNSNWEPQSVKSVSLFDRIRLAGLDTIIYRLAIKISKFIPQSLSKGDILITSENELIIEAAANLFKKGYSIKSLKYQEKGNHVLFEELNIKQHLLPIIKRRVGDWVDPSLIDICSNHMLSKIYSNALLTKKYYFSWKSILHKVHNNTKVLSNSPAGIQGNVLYDVCKQKKIPVIGVLHGSTHEINKLIAVRSAFFDASLTDFFLTHTDIAKKVQQNNPFSIGSGHAIGLPSRTLRMRDYKRKISYNAPILYASTNLYRGCLVPPYTDQDTDYGGFVREYNLASSVFSKIPHELCYKTYPLENRRFPDEDPIEGYINRSENLNLIKEKVDMRYLLSSFKVIITSGATSTLGWAVMTEKPLIFINWARHNPLSDDAYESLNKGIFLFDGDSENFHNKLLSFLSKSIEDIFVEWNEKEHSRIKMIEKYFSKNTKKIGSSASDIIENMHV
mgnify:CR=1 FL=1